MVSVKTKQSVGFGALMTLAIGLITWGVNGIQAETGEWYVNLGVIIVGLVMIVIDTYVLKTQENC